MALTNTVPKLESLVYQGFYNNWFKKCIKNEQSYERNYYNSNIIVNYIDPVYSFLFFSYRHCLITYCHTLWDLLPTVRV